MVEDVLVPLDIFNNISNGPSLNPCCGGRCSSTQSARERRINHTPVLILVVVEDVLVLAMGKNINPQIISLNPCCGGRCSSTLSWTLQRLTEHLSLNPCCGGRCSSTLKILKVE